MIVTDQAGNSRSGTSDAIGRLTKVTENPGSSQYDSIYTYDVLGRLRKTAQTLDSTTQYRYFMYNDLGRLTRAKQVEQGTNSNLNITDPVTGNSSWSVGYDYDDNGNILSTRDALNRTITGTYDVLNRLELRDYSDSTPDVSFTYEDQNVSSLKGVLTTVSSSVSTTSYTAFDVLGRIKSSSQTTDGQTYSFSDYSYDLSGTLVSETYPSGRVVTTETDNIGRLSRVASQLPNSVQKTMLSQVGYTSFGAVQQARLGNGKWESAQFYDQRMQIKQVGLGSSAGDTSLLKLEYGYGTTSTNNGSLKQQKITMPGAGYSIVQDYTYDDMNRLQSATETVNSSQTWKQTFSIDRFGNRRFDANNTTTLGSCSQAACNPNMDLDKNRLAVSDGYSYDTEGNLTANPENQSFGYDAENHLIHVDNSATQTTANYAYDGQAKRVKKKIGNQETYFVYDAFGKLVAEYVLNQTPTQNGTEYLTSDAIGSPRVATNAIGAVVSRHDYMPYGEEVESNLGGRSNVVGYGQTDNARQKFTGYERDDESGLDFAQARYYLGKHGRFMSVDPLMTSANLQAPESFNRYGYGNNSPYKFVDPLGTDARIRCGGAGAGTMSSGKDCDDPTPDDTGFDNSSTGEDPSTHIDANGNVITVYDDGDLGVYQHPNNADGKAPTAAQLDKRHKKSTSAGGTRVGETEDWDEFVSPETGRAYTNHRILVGLDLTSNIEDLHGTSLEFNLQQIASMSGNGGAYDIKKKLGKIGFLLNGHYVTARSAGNYLAGYNASTSTLYGVAIEWETFQKMAGAMQVLGRNLYTSEKVDIALNGKAYGPPPAYGELEYQRRMSARGWNHGRP